MTGTIEPSVTRFGIFGSPEPQIFNLTGTNSYFSFLWSTLESMPGLLEDFVEKETKRESMLSLVKKKCA